MNIPFLQEILKQIFNICSAKTKSNTFSLEIKPIWYFQTQYKSTPQKIKQSYIHRTIRLTIQCKMHVTKDLGDIVNSTVCFSVIFNT